MVEVTKYPTVATPDVSADWSNPSYAIGAPDGNCALAKKKQSKCYLSSFGFNIPSNAVIDEIYIVYKMVGYYYGAAKGDYATAALHKGYITCSVDKTCLTLIQYCYCADTVEADSQDWQPTFTLGGIPFTVDDLNNENFDLSIYDVALENGLERAWFDAVGIKVEYHVPVVAKAGLNIPQLLPIILGICKSGLGGILIGARHCCTSLPSRLKKVVGVGYNGIRLQSLRAFSHKPQTKSETQVRGDVDFRKLLLSPFYQPLFLRLKMEVR